MATADSIIDAANTRATDILGMADSVAAGLVEMGSWDSWVRWNIPSTSFSSIPGFSAVPSPSMSVPLNQALPALPSASGMPVPAKPNVPAAPTTNIGAAPVLSIGATPVLNLPDPTSYIGSITVDIADVPDAPVLSEPAAPTLSNIDIPDPPVINLPTLAAQAPLADFIPLDPKRIEDYYGFSTATGRIWQSDIFPVIENKMLSDIQTGGTGIDSDVQAAMFGKAAERDLMAVNDAMKLASEQFGKRGYPLPSGRLQAQHNELLDKYAATRADKSRDIVVLVAELAQKNIQFAITGLTQIEQIQVQFAIAFVDRMLNMAKASVDAAIAWTNASIAEFNAELDAYKTEASVYASRLQAERERLEIYKGELDGARLKGELNLQQLEIYKARMAALEISSKLYQAKIDGYNANINAQRSKVEIFKARADVYQSMVQSKTAEIQAYEAQIRGEVSKVQAYTAQVDAEKAKVQIYAAQADAAIKVAEADVSYARLWNEQYSGQITAYRAQVEALTAQQGNAVQVFKAQLDANMVQNEVAKANAMLYAEWQKVQVEQWKAQAGTSIEGARLAATHMVQNANVRVQALQGVMGAYASMASGAMSAVNGIAQVVTQA